MASKTKRKPADNRTSKGTRKRKPSISDEEGPAFLSSKYAERPVSKIYNSHFRNNTPAELFRKDLISAMKLPDSEPLSNEDFWHISDSWKPEWERGVQVPVNPEILPETNVKILRKRKKDAAFKLPKKLIHLQQDASFSNERHVLSYSAAHAERACQYDMDDVDMQWLSQLNEEREDFGLSPVEENVFELIIEELENTCHDNLQEAIRNEEGLGLEYDEDAICDVCRSPDSEEGNEMVFCDSCNVCVHQACYGITKIPDGSWICRTCALGLRPSCVLCPNKGGAMKSTRSGQRWSHVSCALWVPEVTIGCVEKMEPIIKLSQIPSSRWALVCSLCKEKVGACIQCSIKFCKTAYHVTCAFEHGLQMQAILDESDEDVAGIKLKSYCLRHSKKKKVSSSDSESDAAKEEREILSCKEVAVSAEEKASLRQQKIEEHESLFYNYVSVDELSGLYEIEENVLKNMINYWKLKRKANYNRPLLPPKTVNLNSSFLESNYEYGVIEKILSLRRDLERARNLLYMVSKREKLSRSWTKVKKDIFLKQEELIMNENIRLTREESNAVLLANYGDCSYDKKYTGLSVAPPNAVDVLNALMGQDYVKTHLNGIFKTNKKSERLQSQKIQTKESNPYAKHYLNGLLKRSQRWLVATMDRQNRDKSVSFSNENAIQQVKKDTLELNFAGTSNDIRSQTTDIENYLLNTINQDKNHLIERKSKGYLGSSSMKSLVSSQIKREQNVASNQQSVEIFSHPTEEKNERDETEQEIFGVSLNERLTDNSSNGLSLHVKLETALLDSNKLSIQKKGTIQNSSLGVGGENSHSNIRSACLQELKEKRKESLKKEVFVIGNEYNLASSHHTFSELMTDIDDAEVKHQNAILKANDEKNIKKVKLTSKGSWSRRRKLKYLSKKIKVETPEVLNKSDSAIESQITFNGEGVVTNNYEVFSDNICTNYVEVNPQIFSHDDVKILQSEFLKSLGNVENSVAESRGNDELHDKGFRIREIPEHLEESLKSRDKTFFVEDFKCKRIKKKGAKVDEKSIEPEFLKVLGAVESSKTSPIELNDLKCNKEGKKLLISVAKLDVLQPTPCTMSSPVKSPNCDIEPCDKQNLRSASSRKMCPSEKVSPGDGKSTLYTQRHKSLLNNEASSPSSSLSSVSKHNSFSSSNKCHSKSSSVNIRQKREMSPDKLKTSECSVNIASSFFPSSALPKKGSLSGYKIPKKVKTDVEESSLEKKRGQSPLSPLAECSSSPNSNSSYPSNSYQSRPVKTWTNNHRLQQKRTLANGESESQSERLVLKLRKDLSDPDSQRWKADSSCCSDKSGWTGELQSVPSSVQPRFHSQGSKQWMRLQTISVDDRRPQRLPYGTRHKMT